jgi:hypothetical protein
MPTTYAIPDGRTVMAATLYTGNGGTLAVSNAVNGVSFQPDWVWIKNRTNAYNHREWDSVRGVGAGYLLLPNTTDAEGNASQEARGLLTALNSNGFTVGPGSTDAIGVNESGSAFVAWQWKAGGTAVSNTAGSITSSVSANTTAGFSVVTYTGTGVTATIGHGLGVAPQMIIVKNRAAAESWRVGHSFMNNGSSPWSYYMNLNGTGAQVLEASIWNNTAPTSTVFTISNDSAVSGNGQSHVAYCFAPVAGYSAFGSYTGNGSTDGPFVYLGFRPRFVVVKLTSSSGQAWYMSDSSRSPNNVVQTLLEANSSSAEFDTGASLDYLSNGFKIRESGTGFNGSGSTYIYMAFAENPFKYANAR